VIEADEYDTAFFDKRSKFVHYHPKTLVINNLEFDHAEPVTSKIQANILAVVVFPCVPLIASTHLSRNTFSIRMGLYSEQQTLPTSKLEISDIGTTFNVEDNAVNWNLLGEHNMQNGLCAIYAAHHIGVEIILIFWF
jgi:UDP-N-acetylmuramate: L-alanyl-gamma-D-glutamyl-meso-diaminopimelate ligase